MKTENDIERKMSMTFLDLAKERFSVRAFKEQMPEEEKIAKILEAGKVAPTACNNQPQKIYVVKSEENRKKLSTVCQCTFDAPVILAIGYDAARDWKNNLAPVKITALLPMGYPAGKAKPAPLHTSYRENGDMIEIL